MVQSSRFIGKTGLARSLVTTGSIEQPTTVVSGCYVVRIFLPDGDDNLYTAIRMMYTPIVK
jgi:hypothetical protein